MDNFYGSFYYRSHNGTRDYGETRIVEAENQAQAMRFLREEMKLLGSLEDRLSCSIVPARLLFAIQVREA